MVKKKKIFENFNLQKILIFFNILVFERQLKKVLKSKTKWELQFDNMPDIDTLKPTRSAESIIVMIESLTSKYLIFL